jgi:hypothetical protein
VVGASSRNCHFGAIERRIAEGEHPAVATTQPVARNWRGCRMKLAGTSRPYRRAEAASATTTMRPTVAGLRIWKCLPPSWFLVQDPMPRPSVRLGMG